MTVGIALGAGGPLGWAFHLGVLDGIRDALGVEPAHAQRVVGTSAGGAIAASLLSGADTATVLASISAPMSDADQAEMRSAMRGSDRGWRRFLRPLAPGTAVRRLPTAPVTAAVGLLPGGVFPTFPLRRFPVPDEAEWPPSLWLPSVRMDRGELVVFGRDRTDVDIRDALEATSAVPGMFRPKRIDGVAHVDGAVASATHADLLADDGHETVVISSVMSRPGRGPVKIRARHQLRQEVATLERAGTRVVVIEPSAEVIEMAKGWPRTGGERGPEIVAAAAKQTIDRLGG